MLCSFVLHFMSPPPKKFSHQVGGWWHTAPSKIVFGVVNGSIILSYFMPSTLNSVLGEEADATRIPIEFQCHEWRHSLLTNDFISMARIFRVRGSIKFWVLLAQNYTELASTYETTDNQKIQCWLYVTSPPPTSSNISEGSEHKIEQMKHKASPSPDQPWVSWRRGSGIVLENTEEASKSFKGS